MRGASREGGLHPVEGVERVRVADPLDRQAVRAAVAGADAIVHLAARVHVMRETAADPLAEFRRANVEGTRLLAEEAAAASVGQLVLASTVKAVGEGNSTPWTEDTPPAPTDPYGMSKLEAERAVHDVARRRGTKAAVLRFPLVYGPGVQGNMLRLFALVDRGVPLPFGSVANRRSVLYVGNLVAAVRSVLETSSRGRRNLLRQRWPRPVASHPGSHDRGCARQAGPPGAGASRSAAAGAAGRGGRAPHRLAHGGRLADFPHDRLSPPAFGGGRAAGDGRVVPVDQSAARSDDRAVAAFLGVVLASWLLTGVVRRYALRSGLLDVPNERSLHRTPVPRGGGLAIAVVTLAGLVAAAAQSRIPAPVAWALVAGGAMVAAVGWLDDRPRGPCIRSCRGACGRRVLGGLLDLG